ncbi:MAG: hypothetical protein RR342_01205 [Bacilli bacterium]
MKYKVKSENKLFLVDASSEVEAVKKLKNAKTRKLADSIMSEFDDIRREMGEKKWKAIDEYCKKTGIPLEKVLYNKGEYEKFAQSYNDSAINDNIADDIRNKMRAARNEKELQEAIKFFEQHYDEVKSSTAIAGMYGLILDMKRKLGIHDSAIKDYGIDIAVPGTNIIAIGIEDLFDYIRWIKDSLSKGDKSRAERLAEDFKRLLSERKKSVAGLPQYTNAISKYVQEAEKEFNSIKM